MKAKPKLVTFEEYKRACKCNEYRTLMLCGFKCLARYCPAWKKLGVRK